MNSDAPINNQRLAWIDYSRGILMFLVYYYHSEVYYSTGHSLSWLFAPFFLGGFFFVSGYLFKTGKDDISIRTKIKAVFRGVIFPYIIFTSAMYVPKIIIDNLNPQQGFIDIITFRASWFVTTIGFLQILYAIMYKFIKDVRYITIATILLILFGFMINTVYPAGIPPYIKNNPWIYSSTFPERLPLCLVQILLSSPFFMAGILYRKHEHLFKKFESWRSIIIFGILYIIIMSIDKNIFASHIYMATNSYHNYILVVIYGLLGTLIITSLSKKMRGGVVRSIVKYAGKNSLIFYFLNAVSIRIASYISHFTGIDNILGYGTVGIFTISVISFMLTVPMVYLIMRYIPIITGNKEAFSKLSQRLHINVQW